MASREAKLEQTRRRIMDAAGRLFARDGYDATSTRTIASEAGIAHGTLFRYAPTKEDLVELIFADSIGDALGTALATVDDVNDGSFTDVCLHFYTAFFGAYSRDAALARVLVKELPFLSGEALVRQNTLTMLLFQALGEDVERRQQRGSVDGDQAAMTITAATFSLYYGALVGWLSGQLDKDGALALLEMQLRTFERGLAPPTTSSATTPTGDVPAAPGGSDEQH